MLFFFFNDTATTEIYTLSLHDALPIWFFEPEPGICLADSSQRAVKSEASPIKFRILPVSLGKSLFRTCHKLLPRRSEEHTSELQSHLNLVCRLLLEKKKIHITRS